MNDPAFETLLDNLYDRPVDAASAAALTAGVMARVNREARARRRVMMAAGAAGALLSAGAFSLAGGWTSFEHASRAALAAAEPQTLYLGLTVAALATLAALTQRLLREA